MTADFEGNPASVPAWLAALDRPAVYPHAVREISLIETHLSWVFLTGDWAYKLKKPLRFSFVDFSTIDKRHAACLEELRLNRRTAAALYDQVVPLVQTEAGPRFGGRGEILEYAVRMRQFPQADILLNVAKDGRLTEATIEALSRSIATLHRQAGVVSRESGYGVSEVIRKETGDCLDELARSPLTTDGSDLLTRVRSWAETEGERLDSYFAMRHRGGFVRECHGDLHLGNIVLVDGVPVPFDCIEFNPELRFTDVFNDVAFVTMDLHVLKFSGFAWQFLNGWLEETGDFGGLLAWRYYQVYRALVRAKVAAIRLAQGGSATESLSHQDEVHRYLALASDLSRPTQPALILMHGVSGSGKSTEARRISTALGGVRIRSDVERKRLFGVWPPEPSMHPPDDLYSPEATSRTYDHLLALTEQLLGEGFLVVVDAAFLRANDRLRFQQLAHRLRCPWTIAVCEAADDVLEVRVKARQAAAVDPSDATVSVLNIQRQARDKLTDDECARTVRFRTDERASWLVNLGELRRLTMVE